MAGAARSTRRKAACIGLLGVAWACATIQDPPGGPPDYTAPVLLAVVPDSGAMLDGFEDDVEFQFDEVVSERAAGGLETLILLSPRPEELRVSWKRTRISVKPREGWRTNAIYHVTLLPGVVDLRNNRLDSSRTIVFSTGGPIPDTRMTGVVVDWEAGSAARTALVEAVLLPDSLTYVTRTDSSGAFLLSEVPRGPYLRNTTIDQNNNGMRDVRESVDSVSIQLDSAAEHTFWTFAHDTTGPRLSGVSDLDSLTIRLTFTQMLPPGEAPSGAIQVLSLPVADSIREELAQAETDSLRAAGADSLLPDTTVQARPEAQDTAVTDEADSATADTSLVTRLLTERPKLSDVLYVRLESNLTPGGRYLLVARVANLLGAVEESQQSLVVAEPPDST
ncbi:MAG: Ig-like domain-containing protein [Gemmatimonadales bacterium]